MLDLDDEVDQSYVCINVCMDVCTATLLMHILMLRVDTFNMNTVVDRMCVVMYVCMLVCMYFVCSLC